MQTLETRLAENYEKLIKGMDRRDFMKKGILATIAIGIGLKAKNSQGEESIPRNHENLYENIAKRMEQMNSEKRYDEVIALGEQYANQQDNRSGYFFNELGAAYNEKNNLNRAEELFEKAIATGSEKDSYWNLAIVQYKKRDYKKTIHLLEKYISLGGKRSEEAKKRIEMIKKKVQ